MILYFDLEGTMCSAKELVTDRWIEQRNKCSKPMWKARTYTSVRKRFVLTHCCFCDTVSKTPPFCSEIISHPPLLSVATWPVVHGPWFNSSSWLHRGNRINQSAYSTTHEDRSLCSLCLKQCLDGKGTELFTTALGARSQCWFVMGLDLISWGCERRISPEHSRESLLLSLVAQAVALSPSLHGNLSSTLVK